MRGSGRPTGWRAFVNRIAGVFERTRIAGTVLSMDWSGAQRELLIGRHPSCELRIAASTVSRRHARLLFRDGGWIVQDLRSRNGTMLNGTPVGRCRLSPGDRLTLADQSFRVA